MREGGRKKGNIGLRKQKCAVEGVKACIIFFSGGGNRVSGRGRNTCMPTSVLISCIPHMPSVVFTDNSGRHTKTAGNPLP